MKHEDTSLVELSGVGLITPVVRGLRDGFGDSTPAALFWGALIFQNCPEEARPTM